MSYKINTATGDIHRDDGLVIAPPYGAQEYQEYATWIHAGNVPELFLAQPVPESVDARQMRLALNRAGLRDMVEAAIAAGERDLGDWWLYTQIFPRHHSMVAAMIAALGVTPDQADAVWVLGATL